MTRITLNERTLQALKTTKEREWYWDRNFHPNSFGVRVFKCGRKQFVFTYRDASGDKRQVNLGDAKVIKLAEARDAAYVQNREIVKGSNPALAKQQEREAPLFSALIEKFREIYYISKKLRKKTILDYEMRIKKYLIPNFGTKKINAIQKQDIIDLIDKIMVNHLTQAKKVQELIHTIYSFAVKRGMVDKNPCSGIQRIKTDPRDRHFNDAEIRNYWTVVDSRPEPIRGLFKLLLLTGQRSGQMLEAKWEHVQDGEWKFPDTKTVMQSIPVTPLIRSVLSELHEGNMQLKARSHLTDKTHFDKFMFPAIKIATKHREKHLRSPRGPCDTIKRDMGNVHFRPHDLRRTATTLMRRCGVPKDTVRKILNHATGGKVVDLLGVYDHYDEWPEMLDALTKLGDLVLGIVSGKVAGGGITRRTVGKPSHDLTLAPADGSRANLNAPWEKADLLVPSEGAERKAG